jgi:hypothetical protein
LVWGTNIYFFLFNEALFYFWVFEPINTFILVLDIRAYWGLFYFFGFWTYKSFYSDFDFSGLSSTLFYFWVFRTYWDIYSVFRFLGLYRPLFWFWIFEPTEDLFWFRVFEPIKTFILFLDFRTYKRLYSDFRFSVI